MRGMFVYHQSKLEPSKKTLRSSCGIQRYLFCNGQQIQQKRQSAHFSAPTFSSFGSAAGRASPSLSRASW